MMTLRPWLLVVNQFALTTLVGKAIETLLRATSVTMLTLSHCTEAVERSHTEPLPFASYAERPFTAVVQKRSAVPFTIASSRTAVFQSDVPGAVAQLEA